MASLLKLASSFDISVQKNATEALLNLTHLGVFFLRFFFPGFFLQKRFNLESNRQQLIRLGAVPIFVSHLSSGDNELQYFSLAALSNLAGDGKKLELGCCQKSRSILI